MKIVEVCLICDTVEAGYRIVYLDEGLYAFVWGNIAASLGDVLSRRHLRDSTSERGIRLFETFEEAEEAWRDCALALKEYGDGRAGEELLNLLGQ